MSGHQLKHTCRSLIVVITDTTAYHKKRMEITLVCSYTMIQFNVHVERRGMGFEEGWEGL